MFFDYIAYSASNTGERCVFVIYIHKGRCTTLIFILLQFDLFHWYNIQDSTGWMFGIFLHFVKMIVWDCSVLTQYSYYRHFYCLWPASRLHDCAIVGYNPTPDQQVSVILWNINITVWLKSQVYHVTYFLINVWRFYTTKYKNTLHSHFFVVLGDCFQTTGLFGRRADFLYIF